MKGEVSFEIFTADKEIHEACRIVSSRLFEFGFYEQLCNVEKFNLSTYNGKQVWQTMFQTELTVEVREYKTWNPWSKVIGHAKGNVIYFNMRKKDLSQQDSVEFILHELMHLWGFKHKGNKVTAFNLKTVPYLVARMFAKYITTTEKMAA
jgi:predicted metallopeptidase